MTDLPPDSPGYFDTLESQARAAAANMSDEQKQRLMKPTNMSDGVFDPNTPVCECVAVVVSPDHPRFSQIAAIRMHDWKEFGQLYLEFDDGHRETFRDGLITNEPIPPEALVFKRSDEAALAQLLERLPKIKLQLRRLFRDCYKRSQLWESRLNHRRNFFALLEGEEVQQSLPV